MAAARRYDLYQTLLRVSQGLGDLRANYHLIQGHKGYFWGKID